MGCPSHHHKKTGKTRGITWPSWCLGNSMGVGGRFGFEDDVDGLELSYGGPVSGKVRI